jgi:hypothetical protein
MHSKDKIITSLQTAQAELQKALANLAQLPAFDASHVRFAAHMLANYLTVTIGTWQIASRSPSASRPTCPFRLSGQTEWRWLRCSTTCSPMGPARGRRQHRGAVLRHPGR